MNVLPDGSVPSLKMTTAVLSSLVDVIALSAEGTIIGFTSKNKMKFHNRIKEVDKKYNRCYLFYEKARADKKITNEELTRFYSIFKD